MIDIVWTNWPITWGLLAATLLVQTAIPAKDLEADLRSLAPHACGIAAAKVKAIRTVDLRGGDGPLVREFTLDVIRATGRVPEIARQTIARGGHVGPTQPQPANKDTLPGFAMNLKPETGQTYWFVFLMLERFSPPVLTQIHPIDDPGVAAVYERAVQDNSLRWQPIYDRKLDLELGHRLETEDRWQLRVSRGPTVLWTRDFEGIQQPDRLGFYTAGLEVPEIPATMPESGALVMAATRRTLDPDRDGSLPAQPYDLVTAYEPITGALRIEYFYTVKPPAGCVLIHEYQPESGRLMRVDRLETKPRDDGQQDWIRTSTFLTQSGKTSKTFLYGRKPNGWMGWVEKTPR